MAAAARLSLSLLALVGREGGARAGTASPDLKLETAYSFAQLTDLHLEPFYSPENSHVRDDICRASEAYNKSACVPFQILPDAGAYPWGRLNCDPPDALIRSMLQSIRNVTHTGKKPDFIIFTGDAPSHKLSCQHHAARAIELVVQLLSQRVMDIAPVYPVMGNNDYFPNYNVSLEPNSEWQEYIANMYARWGMLSGDQLTTFRKGGFYAVSPKPGLKLLVLNTVIWSHKVLDWGHSPKLLLNASQVTNQSAFLGPDAPFPDVDDDGWIWNTEAVEQSIFLSCSLRPHDPYGQLAWARRELELSKDAGQRVIIAGHVPPGNKVGENNFCEQYDRDLIQLSREFSDTIEVQLYGDHSTDEFRMFWSEEDEHGAAHAVSSVLVSAGVTPRKHCNPSWRMFDVSSDHNLLDFTQFYFPLINANLEWQDRNWNSTEALKKSTTYWIKQYSFREQYGVGLSPPELEQLWMDMQAHPDVLTKYMRNMFSQTIGNKDYFDYLCDMRYMESASNRICAEKGRLLEGDNPADRVAVQLLRERLALAELSEKAKESPQSLKAAEWHQLIESRGKLRRQIQQAIKPEADQSPTSEPLVVVCALLAASTTGFGISTAFLALKLSRRRREVAGECLLS